MSTTYSPLAFIIKQIRTVLMSSRYAVMHDVHVMVEQAFVLISRENRDDPQTEKSVSELAFLLSTMLDSTFDASFIRMGLGMLLRLGPMGEMLASRYLLKRKLPNDTLKGMLASFSAKDQLWLVNLFFRDPHLSDPWLLTWAYEVTREHQGDDPDEVHLFLEELNKRGGAVAYPLQRELLRSRFGVWLQRLLSLELDKEQLLFLAKSIGQLESHYIASSMVKHLKKADDETLLAVLKVIALSGSKQNPALIKVVLPYIKHRSVKIRIQALKTLAILKTNTYGAAAAHVFINTPARQEALYPLLLDMPFEHFKQFMQKQPPAERSDILLTMAAYISALDADWMIDTSERILATRKAQSQDWKQLVQAVADYAQGSPPHAFEPFYIPAPTLPGEAAEEPEPSSFIPAALLKLVKQTLKGDTEETEREEQLRQKFIAALEPDTGIDKAAFENLPPVSVTIDRMMFSTVKFFHLDLSKSTVQDTQFLGCRFKHVYFDGSAFTNVSFNSCEFTHCRFSDSALEGMVFFDCDMTATHFAGSDVKRLSLTRCLVKESDFSAARFVALAVERSRFEACHFSLAALYSINLGGVEFADCNFYKTFAQHGVIRNIKTNTSQFAKCRMSALDTDDPGFSGQVAETALAMFSQMGFRKPQGRVPPQLGSADGLRVLYQIIEQWLFERGVMARQRVFLLNNRRRLDWATCMIKPPSSDTITILPGLIEAGFMQDMGEVKAPGCVIHGYMPDYTTGLLLEKYGGASQRDADKKPSRKQDSGPPIPIEGVFSIGSTGTIAQAKSSDIDLWVLYDAHKVSAKQISLLQQKLTFLESWCLETLKQEVHFFLMDLASVQENNFGFADSESVGSTQAKLLKEEFYRTSIHLAGKKPAWWLMDINLSEHEYAANLRRLGATAMHIDKEMLDLGNLEDVPKEEFFGASLWQIVKAMKSPFKSVMKLALLDKYIHGENVEVLLCNKIKNALFLGVRDMWEVDPYAVMFRGVFEYYRDSEQDDAQNLMRLAFLQKTGLKLAMQATGRFYEMQEYSYMEYFFPYSEADIASYIEPNTAKVETKNKKEKKKEYFEELIDLGNMVIRYMFETYFSIQRLWGEFGSELLITQEDMTKLGRKIYSSLKTRDHKIMRIPFLDSSKHVFSALEFSSESTTTGPTFWVVRGQTRLGRTGKVGMETIRKDESLERLLLWLVANGVYYKEMPMRAGPLEKPLSMQELTEILEKMSEMFPPYEIFEPDLNNYLDTEKAIKAFILANLTTPREEKTFRKATLIYATNWGELFCFTQPEMLDALANSAFAFVKGNINQVVDPDIIVAGHTPHRAMCPQIFAEG